MKSDGRVRYENYNGSTGKGLKNKRVRKREIERRVLREIRREVRAKEKALSYKKKNFKEKE